MQLDKHFQILAINPGSTSTKVAVFCDETILVEKSIRHPREDLDACGSILGQEFLRLKSVLAVLEQAGISEQQLDAVVGRGGLLRPIASGTYAISDEMLRDLHGTYAGEHASALGGILAHKIAARNGIPSYIVDPVVVDELEPLARLSGIPEIQRKSVFHALNTKYIARACAKELGLRYEDARFVIAHLGGGITVAAHRYGHVVDVNDAVGGDGPFTPERCGGVPAKALIDLCFSGKYNKNELLAFVNRGGGMRAYLGTSDLQEAEQRIADGDDQAKQVVDAMAYQVSKQIGAMITVLDGVADAIILTGGLAYSAGFTAKIRQRVEALATVLISPGEEEMPALAQGVLRVLRGEELPKKYLKS